MTSLSLSQKKVITLFNQNKNIFITGPGGVGKSYVINYIKDLAELDDKKIYITATTGSAASLISGKTIHSWAGIGMGEQPVEILLKSIKKKFALRNRWKYTKVLVIDEISMMSGSLFTKLNIIAQTLKCSSQPFGGIQLILSGDFYQLPPICKDGEPDFCFQSEAWNQCIDEMVVLDQNMRQKNPEFQNMLLEIRKGELSKGTKKFLKERAKLTYDTNSDIQPTIIYTTRNKVDEINFKRMKLLNKEVSKYTVKTVLSGIKKSQISTELIKKMENHIDSHSQYSANLELCIGCQVMLISNINQDEGLVNGSRGVITQFLIGYPVVKFLNGTEVVINPHVWNEEINEDMIVGRSQIPLKLAWAITHHKSQGVSLDYAVIDIGKNIFEYGQCYVALSRVRNIEGLFISELKLSRIKAHPLVIEFYENYKPKKKETADILKMLKTYTQDESDSDFQLTYDK